MWRVILIGTTLVATGILVVTALAQSQSRAPDRESRVQTRDSEPETRDEFTVKVTDEMRRHSRIRYILYFVGSFYGFGVLLLILFSGLSRRMRELGATVTRRKFAVAMVYVALFSVATAILSFPLDLYSGFIVPHQFNLSNQSLGEWFIEGLKGLGISIILGALIAPVAFWLIRRMPRRWWLALWFFAIPVAILLIVVAPVLIDPVFNKFEPLKDAALRAKLLTLASRAGISGADVFQVDKSKQTKTMNAYVTGIGPTKRIVLWDTLLAKMNHDEVLAVMGHEMGHYVLHHVWKTLGFVLAVLLAVFFVGQMIVDRGTRRWGARWGFASPDDPAALPWLILVVSAVTFLLTPVFAAYSRGNEHDADVFSLELTRLNEPAARSFIKLAEDSKVEPQPPVFIEYWLYSHPPLAKRIRFALSYKPWERGEPNRLWEERP